MINHEDNKYNKEEIGRAYIDIITGMPQNTREVRLESTHKNRELSLASSNKGQTK
jgi:hypothetical protein